MNSSDLKWRTKKFALRIIKLARALNKDNVERKISDQILRSGTSVASNYRAALRAKSKSDFIAKLGIIVEEGDETMFWLEIIVEAGILKKEAINDLYREANEIVAIIVKTRDTSFKNHKS
ncbi:MAG: four helix bundle protein [Patescibacteria group bacterium]